MSAAEAPADPFTGSRACLEDLLGWLEGTEATGLTHAELEAQLDRRGRELLRRMFQGQLDLRALREHRLAVIDADGVPHGAVETGHSRPLATLFGQADQRGTRGALAAAHLRGDPRSGALRRRPVG